MSYLRVKAPRPAKRKVVKAREPRISMYALGERLDAHSTYVVHTAVSRYRYKGVAGKERP